MDNGNETKIAVSFDNTVKNLDKLTKYEEKLQKIYGFISGLKRADSKQILNAVNENAKNVSKEVKDIEKNAKDTSKTLKNMFNLSILEKYEKSLYKLTKTMFQLSQKSTEYIENVNLLEVAYKNQNESIEQSSERIEKYIEKMSKVYGLDESRLTRQFGIFKQLANAMQLPTETAENLSEIMVKMTNDIASLYNLPLDRASNALQSALAGQVRPIKKSSGFTLKNVLKKIVNTSKSGVRIIIIQLFKQEMAYLYSC